MDNEIVNDPRVEDIWEQQIRKITRVWTICHTPNCVNENVLVPSISDFDPPIVYCGPCSRLIEDITPFSEKT